MDNIEKNVEQRSSTIREMIQEIRTASMWFMYLCGVLTGMIIGVLLGSM